MQRSKSARERKRPLLNTSLCKYDIVRNCAEAKGFRIDENVESTNWSIFWIDTGVSVARILSMHQVQKINHFPGMHEICRKDYLARNLARLNKLFPKDYNFFPKTWILPNDCNDFKQSSGGSKCFIAKPDHGCQGKGIFLFKSSKDLLTKANPDEADGEMPSNLIIQTYLSKPLLIDGFKFDLRGILRLI